MTTKDAVQVIQDTFCVNPIFAHYVFRNADKKNLIASSQEIIDEKPKPFVKWVGGKRQLLKQFKEMGLYPPDAFDPATSTFHEPFVGGGAVFFDLLPKNAILSDWNQELVTAYNVIKNDVEALIVSLKKHKHEKEYFLKIRAQDPEKLSDLQVASRFIYLNRTAFNGMYRVNSSGGFNVPFGKYNNPLICDAQNLRKVSKALQKVTIKKQDYKEVLKKAKKGNFVYFDPPYAPVSVTASFTAYTKDGFGAQQQKELRDVFVELHKRGCYVMLSNSDVPFINEIYSGIKGVTINKVQAGRAINAKASGRGKVSEVLVVNY